MNAEKQHQESIVNESNGQRIPLSNKKRTKIRNKGKIPKPDTTSSVYLKKEGQLQ